MTSTSRTAVVTVLSWGLATAACGARSDGSGPLDHDGLTTRDGGVVEQVAIIDVGGNVRPNPVRPNPGVSNPDPVGFEPEPGIDPMPPVSTPDPFFEPEPMPVGEPSSEPSPDPVSEPEPLPAEPEPVEPEPVEPEVPADDDVPPEPDAPRLWLYFNDGNGRLVNLYDTGEAFDVPAIDPHGPMLKPWSTDGRNLALFRGTTISFFDLVTGQEVFANDTGTGMTLFGWVDGYGALLLYYYEANPVLYLGSPEGDFTILGEEPKLALATLASNSPGGSGFTYATDSDGEGTAYWVSLANGVNPPLELLSGPLLDDVVWSDDGRWFAVGDNSGSWAVADTQSAGDTFQIGPGAEGLHFSAGANALSFFDGDVQVAWLGPVNQIRIDTVSDRAGTSPAAFSPDGSFLYYPEGPRSGVLRSLSLGSVNEAYDLPDFAEQCPLTFTSPSAFVYQQCAAGSPARGLVAGVVQNGMLSTTTQNETLLENFAVGPAGRCFVNFGGSQLEVGVFDPPLVTEFTRSAALPITHAALAPRDNAVVWVEGGDELYWLPLNADCTVGTLPVLVSERADMQSLAFVAEWP